MKYTSARFVDTNVLLYATPPGVHTDHELAVEVTMGVGNVSSRRVPEPTTPTAPDQ